MGLRTDYTEKTPYPDASEGHPFASAFGVRRKGDLTLYTGDTRAFGIKCSHLPNCYFSPSLLGGPNLRYIVRRGASMGSGSRFGFR